MKVKSYWDDRICLKGNGYMQTYGHKENHPTLCIICHLVNSKSYAPKGLPKLWLSMTNLRPFSQAWYVTIKHKSYQGTSRRDRAVSIRHVSCKELAELIQHRKDSIMDTVWKVHFLDKVTEIHTMLTIPEPDVQQIVWRCPKRVILT